MFAGLTLSYKIFLTFGLNDGIFYRLLSVLQNIVMDMNNAMRLVCEVALTQETLKQNAFDFAPTSCKT